MWGAQGGRGFSAPRLFRRAETLPQPARARVGWKGVGCATRAGGSAGRVGGGRRRGGEGEKNRAKSGSEVISTPPKPSRPARRAPSPATHTRTHTALLPFPPRTKCSAPSPPASASAAAAGRSPRRTASTPSPSLTAPTLRRGTSCCCRPARWTGGVRGRGGGEGGRGPCARATLGGRACPPLPPLDACCGVATGDARIEGGTRGRGGVFWSTPPCASGTPGPPLAHAPLPPPPPPPHPHTSPASLHIEYPMLFKAENRAAGRHTHCGVLEFVADEGVAYMPYWVRRRRRKRERERERGEGDGAGGRGGAASRLDTNPLSTPPPPSLPPPTPR